MDLTQLDTNSSDGRAIFGLETYALQMQDIDPDRFVGQTFSVELGSVEDAMKSGGIGDESLKTSKRVIQFLDNSTAAIQIPKNFFEQPFSDMSTNKQQPLQRLSYSVFLTDILFQINSSLFDVGSIILSVRLQNLSDNELDSSVRTIFRTNSEVGSY